MAKISGPLLDRIDIHIEVPAVPFKELSTGAPGTSSSDMREQVIAARKIQAERFARVTAEVEADAESAASEEVGERTIPHSNIPHARYNGQMTSRQIRQFCKLNNDCFGLLKSAVNEMGLSARAHDKILRTARTIADLDQCADIETSHISEAINYRMLDRQMWT